MADPDTPANVSRQVLVPPPSVPREDEQQSTQTTTYGSFWINRSEFALPVDTIREIVTEPDEIISVPLSAPFLKGLFNIRGMTIPIVDLHQLFELPPSDCTEVSGDKRKVAIVENGDQCVGIMFDTVGEVLKNPVWAGVNLQTTSTNVKGGIINGVLSLELGNRTVLSIDPGTLFGLDNVPHVRTAKSKSAQSDPLKKRRSSLVFEVGHSKCAVDLRYIHEVLDMPIIDGSWLRGDATIGTVTLRGTIIPVVDFKSYMGDEPVFSLDDSVLSQRKLVIIKTNSGLVGLMVYSVDSIIQFFEHDVSLFAKLAFLRSNVVKGCLFGKNKEEVMLLDHNELVADPDLDGLAKTCREIQNGPKTVANETKKSALAKRKAFVLFSLGGCFSMDTSYVTEVINRPETLLQPSFGSNFVEGIINLRGELITLFNLRMIYGMATCSIEQQKVLIFTVEAQKYAILVDSVDEIISATSDRILPSFEIQGSATIGPTFWGVSKFLSFSVKGNEEKSARILDAAELVAYCENMRPF
ncbi:MAG: chemotaxis protein CheW [Paracoccaceae bacterium]